MNIVDYMCQLDEELGGERGEVERAKRGKITNDTHIAKIVRKERGLALVQVLERFSKDPAAREFYVVNYNAESGMVRTAIPADQSAACVGIAPLTPEGVASVAAPRTRHAAMRWHRRMVNDRHPGW